MVLLVALVAIARKVVITDYETEEPELLFTITALAITLTPAIF